MPYHVRQGFLHDAVRGQVGARRQWPGRASDAQFHREPPGAWLLSSGPVNAAGQPTSSTPAGCAGTGPAVFPGCLGSLGIRESIGYQPASRYWPFQLAETGLCLALALALAGYCFRRLSRRLS